MALCGGGWNRCGRGGSPERFSRRPAPKTKRPAHGRSFRCSHVGRNAFPKTRVVFVFLDFGLNTGSRGRRTLLLAAFGGCRTSGSEIGSVRGDATVVGEGEGADTLREGLVAREHRDGVGQDRRRLREEHIGLLVLLFLAFERLPRFLCRIEAVVHLHFVAARRLDARRLTLGVARLLALLLRVAFRLARRFEQRDLGVEALALVLGQVLEPPLVLAVVCDALVVALRQRRRQLA